MNEARSESGLLAFSAGYYLELASVCTGCYLANISFH